MVIKNQTLKKNELFNGFKTIQLKNGHAEVPRDVKVVNLTDELGVDAGVIADSEGELKPLVIVAGRSLRGLTAAEENRLVDEAIAELPNYCYSKSQEKPFPKTKAEEKAWNDSVRLRFYPLAMIKYIHSGEYRLYED